MLRMPHHNLDYLVLKEALEALQFTFVVVEVSTFVHQTKEEQGSGGAAAAAAAAAGEGGGRSRQQQGLQAGVLLAQNVVPRIACFQGGRPEAIGEEGTAAVLNG